MKDNHLDRLYYLRDTNWTNIPRTTKIVIQDFMIKTDDAAQRDHWGAKWFYDWFGPNVEFKDCVLVAESHEIELKGIDVWVGDFTVEWLLKNYPTTVI